MSHPFRRWRPVGRVLALAVAIAAIPLPSLAEETVQPATKPGIRASVAKVAATTRLEASSGQAAQADKAQLTSGSFFKSTAGVIVLAVVAAGTGYAIYSASNDRIHSVARQNQ